MISVTPYTMHLEIGLTMKREVLVPAMTLSLVCEVLRENTSKHQSISMMPFSSTSQRDLYFGPRKNQPPRTELQATFSAICTMQISDEPRSTTFVAPSIVWLSIVLYNRSCVFTDPRYSRPILRDSAPE